jgi:hypothetical protein
MYIVSDVRGLHMWVSEAKMFLQIKQEEGTLFGVLGTI